MQLYCSASFHRFWIDVWFLKVINYSLAGSWQEESPFERHCPNHSFCGGWLKETLGEGMSAHDTMETECLVNKSFHISGLGFI